MTPNRSPYTRAQVDTFMALAHTAQAEPMRLARDERRDMVRVLSGEGMSTRAIASVVGVKSDSTVRADLAATQVRSNRAPVPVTEPPAQPEPAVTAATVTGPRPIPRDTPPLLNADGTRSEPLPTTYPED